MITETEMIEIIDKKTYDRPELTKHQRFVDFKLWMTLVNKLKRDDLTTQLFPCVVQLDDNTTVKPNILVGAVEKEKGHVFYGVPDLIVEEIHCEVKLAKYASCGVPEYWIVDQSANLVTVHILVEGAYVTTVYRSGDAVPVMLDNKLAISIDKLFRIDYSDEIN